MPLGPRPSGDASPDQQADPNDHVRSPRQSWQRLQAAECAPCGCWRVRLGGCQTGARGRALSRRLPAGRSAADVPRHGPRVSSMRTAKPTTHPQPSPITPLPGQHGRSPTPLRPGRDLAARADHTRLPAPRWSRAADWTA